MNKFLPLILLASLLTVACGSQGEPRGIYGAPPALEHYRDNILPGFASALGLEEVDPEFYSSEFGRQIVERLGLGEIDPERYSSLVRKFREGGLEALADEERGDILRVAQAAFLSYAETLRFAVTSRDASPDASADHGGHATVEEVYVPGVLYPEGSASDGRLARLLGGVHVEGQGISWMGSAPFWDPETPEELRNLIDFPDDGTEPSLGSGVASEWTYQDGEWTCARVDLSTDYEYQMFEEARPMLFFGLAHGTLLGRSMLDDRPVYEFESELILVEEGMRFWLDADTLWLRQYEYEEDGIRYLVKLEAVNEDFRIEAPDVDVECVEEEAE